MTADNAVFSLDSENFSNVVGNSKQAKYIYKYLTDLGVKTAVLEQVYIDKSYSIDYQKFYSRSFRKIEKITRRIHFFSKSFSATEFEKTLESNATEHLKASYLGFVVVKPIRDLRGNPLIGRTLLKTYPIVADSKKRFYVTKDYTASLFGVNLGVKSIPFQVQDLGVSACATIALWTALQSLPSHFEILSYSPAEITELSTEFPSQFRMFPQFGLTLSQIINCIRLVGLDAEVINAVDNEVIITAVKAYTSLGIPIIATLKISKGDTEDHHAVGIVGYQYDINGNVTELYVHDDQIGPYSRIKPTDDSFTIWKNEWNESGHTVELEKLLVPIYHKIRLPFPYIYSHFRYKKEQLSEMDLTLELYLTTVQAYKNFLLRKQINQKNKKLRENLPRFIWIERTFERGEREPLQDDLFDGTAIHPAKLTSIEYLTV